MPANPIQTCSFGPHTTSTCSFGSDATSWFTLQALPWWIIAALLLIWAWGCADTWFRNRYHVTWNGHRPRIGRLWYGTRAHVCLRGHRHETDCHRYVVIRWEDEATEGPWLLVQNLGDDTEPVIWAPAAAFVPYAVRRFRPGLTLQTDNWPFCYETVPLDLWRQTFRVDQS